MKKIMVTRPAKSYLIPNHDPNIQTRVSDEVVVAKSHSWETDYPWAVYVNSADYAETAGWPKIKSENRFRTKHEAISAARRTGREIKYPVYVVV